MKSKSLTTASILTAIAASLCCIGPLVAVGLGLGAFGAGAFFESLRPYLLAATGALLGLAFYLTYRKSSDQQCADGSCAVSPGKKRQKAVLWIATAVVVLAAAFPNYSGLIWGGGSSENTALASGSAPAELAEVVLDVKGMTCGGCVAAVEGALKGQPGVVRVAVSLETNTAEVAYDPARVTVEKLVAAVEEAGYKAAPRG